MEAQQCEEEKVAHNSPLLRRFKPILESACRGQLSRADRRFAALRLYFPPTDFAEEATKDDYVFGGWNTALDGSGTDYASGGAYTIDAGDTLYAKWLLSTPPVISSLDPADNTIGAAADSGLTVTFDENITIGAGNITIRNLTDASDAVIDVTDGTQVSTSGATLTINPAAGLDLGKNYAVRIDADAVTDLIGSPFAGIADDTTWNFQTVVEVLIFSESFENPDVLNDSSTDPVGWVQTQHPGYVHISDENDTSKAFTSTPYGEQALTCYQGGGAKATTTSTILNEVVAADTLYKLSFHVSSYPGRPKADYIVTLLAIDSSGVETVLGSVTGVNDGSSDMSYADLLEVTTTTANVGERIAIRLQHNTATPYQDKPTFDNVQLKISGGALEPGSIDHFVISSISGTQTAGTEISGITITAQDASNATATGFTGTVSFGGTGGFSGTSASFIAGVLDNLSVTPTTAGSDLTFTVDDGASHIGSTTIATIQSVYDGWSGNLGFNVDSNGDGIDNGLAWVLGAADPSANATGLLPAFDNTSDENYSIFTYRRSDAANAASTITCQYGSDLISPWTPAVHDGSDIIITVSDDFYGADPGVDKVEVKISHSLATDGKLFMRLQATPSP